MSGIMMAAMAVNHFKYPLMLVSGRGDAAAGVNASATFTINRNGTWSAFGSPTNTASSSGDWVAPKFATVGDTYWVRVTVTVGAPFTGGSAVGVWLSLSANHSFVLGPATTGAASTNFNIDIATTSTGGNIVLGGSGNLSYFHG